MHLTRYQVGLLAVAVLLPTGGAVVAQTAGAPTAAADTGIPGARISAAVVDSGTFVIRRARDTVATERFVRTATTLRGSVALRNATSTTQSYEAVLAPDGSVALIQVTVRQDLDSGRTKGKVVQRARVIFKEDSAAVDDVRDNGLQTRVFGTRRGVMPYLNLSFALLEQALRRARASSPRSAEVPFFNLGGGQTVTARVSPLGADSLAVAIGKVEFRLRVDPSGRVLGGRIPAQQVVANRVDGPGAPGGSSSSR